MSKPYYTTLPLCQRSSTIRLVQQRNHRSSASNTRPAVMRFFCKPMEKAMPLFEAHMQPTGNMQSVFRGRLVC